MVFVHLQQSVHIIYESVKLLAHSCHGECVTEDYLLPVISHFPLY